jgi:uncharacterized protein (DUF305 family)
MRAVDIRRSALAVFATLAVTACGAAAPKPVETAPQAPATAELEALFRARQDSARMRFSEADVHFMTGMIAHHAQALVMARLAPTRSEHPAVRTLAARIINAQQDEITFMQDWLRTRGQPVPEVHIDGTRLTIQVAAEHQHQHHHQHHHDHAAMPGMLTQTQLDALAGAQGATFDRLFLTSMIQHHRGAIVMVHELLGTDGAAQDPAVFKLASDIHAEQVTEIARMERMLAEFSAAARDP